MGTMYDAVDVAAIPAEAEIVAGYVDGNFPTYDALVAAFPNARHVSITTGATGGAGAMVADCENGDFTAQGAAAWAKGEIAAGRRPCIYYARSNAGAVAAALQAEGIPIADVDYWVADWTGQPHLVAGSVATQYASPTTGSGGNFDVSETTEAWPPVSVPPAPVPDPQPVPEPVPPTTEEETPMVQYELGGQVHIVVYQADKNRTVHYWQAMPSTTPNPPPDYYEWRSEVLTEPA